VVTEAEARRVRPMMSGIVALAVALVTAIGWYYVGRPDESAQPVKTVEWQPWVKSGRADGKLLMLAPDALPAKWRATSASYESGVTPRWHLGMLTGSGKFVGLEEARSTVADLIADSTEGDPTRGSEVELAGTSWQSWTAGDDYLLVRTVQGPGGNEENVIVFGSAPDAEIRAFAASLKAPRS
jgi:hypothetical protein